MAATNEPEPLRQVAARRLATEGAADPIDETVGVVVEAPLVIDVLGVDTYTLLCTPGEARALAVGFLFSEGLIEGAEEIAAIEQPDPRTIRVSLGTDLARTRRRGRNLLVTSSCGACGSEALDEQLAGLPRVGDTLRVEPGLLRAVGRRLCHTQVLFDACGGTHAVGLFDGRGEIVACAEDAGRHNALDKAIGKCLLAGQPTAGRGAALSGRVSLDMVGKCARAGVELIAAVSAPTSLAIEIAERSGITLCAFVREDRASVFTHAHRVVAAAR